MGFLIRLVISWAVVAVAFVVTTYIVPGIKVEGGATSYALVAAVFGLINAFLGPVLRLLTLPLTILTLGLFALVLNALLLALAAWLLPALTIDGFWSALIGGIIIGLVSWALGLVTGPIRRLAR